MIYFYLITKKNGFHEVILNNVFTKLTEIKVAVITTKLSVSKTIFLFLARNRKVIYILFNYYRKRFSRNNSEWWFSKFIRNWSGCEN